MAHENVCAVLSIPKQSILTTTHTRNDFDDVTLPIIMIYQNGNLIHSIIRVTDEIGDTFSKEDLIWLINLYNVNRHCRLIRTKDAGINPH